MTDNRLMFSTGYTPPETQVCQRCFKEFDDPLYVTCQVCREGDKLADFFGGTEIAANALCVRRNELEQSLNAETDKQRAGVLCDELAEVGIALDKLYLPMETYVDARREARFGKSL
jgi:hypothetical protein